MIYLYNRTAAQTVRIPRTQVASGELTLTITGTVTKVAVFNGAVTDTAVSRDYFTFKFALADGTQDGEYEYTLKAGDDVICTGVAVIGNPEVSRTQYNTQIQYTQYGE